MFKSLRSGLPLNTSLFSGVASYIYYYLEHKTSREYKQIFVRMRDRFNIGYNYAKLMAYSAIFISFG